MNRSPVNIQSDGPYMEDVYENKEQLLVLFYWFLTLIVAGLSVGILVTWIGGDREAALIDSASLVLVSFSLYFVRRRLFEAAAASVAFILMTTITLTATNDLGIHRPSLLGYGAILIIASLVTHTRTMLLLLGYNLLCVAWLVFGELWGWYVPTKVSASTPGDFLIVAIILIMTALMVRMLTENMFQNALQLRTELRERQLAEAKYRAIFDNAIDGIFQSTPAGRFVNVNPAMARMYGYASPDDMLASVTDIANQLYVQPEHRKQLRARLNAGEKVNTFESLDVRKDGSTFWTSMNVQAITDETGKVVYYEGTVEDITARKHTEEALRESEARYRSLFNNMLDGIYRSTPAGRFVDINPAMAHMFGYTSQAEMLAVDIPTALFFSPSDRKQDYLLPGEERVDTFLMKRKDGSEIWVEDHGHDLHDEQGRTLYHEGILRDVTDRRRAEQEREHLIQELESKNTELERFTYTVSHDLKAPLVTIRGFLGYLEKDIQSGKAEHVSHDVLRINGAVDKMHTLLNDLLELSRIGRMMNEPETIPFNELVNDALDIVHGQLEAHGLTVQTQPSLPLVKGDRRRLTEVLQNLLDNAAKFMGDQPAPLICIGQRGTDPTTGHPIFFVQDNGMGIAPEHHERIFGLFNKLDAKTEGTGIGLTLVRRIIEFHGGRIWVESAPAQGTTFCFSLAGADQGRPDPG